jgi:ABC-type bacteriocin/lantibiotic exporter with double-glycine peptidase domain
MNIKLALQPTGNSCGPTCLYMALNYIINAPNDLPFDVLSKYTIEDICKMCGTDWEVGTPPDRMEKGMKALGLEYTEYLGSPRPYDLLRQVIDSGNVAIIRTITHGIPHWIIVKRYNFVHNDVFEILCPSQGEIRYDESELEKIWSPRKYQFFEVKLPPNKYSVTHDGNGY